MHTNFNSDELNLIQNKYWFELKASAAAKTSALLLATDKLMRERNIICMKQGGASKITKGENLNGCPYFVLDAPKLKDEHYIFSIRIIVWWGNYITVNLMLGQSVLEQYRPNLMKNIGQMQSCDLFICIDKSLWQHDVYDEKHYIRSVDITGDVLLKLPTLKVSTLIQLNSKNIMINLLDSIETLNALLV